MGEIKQKIATMNGEINNDLFLINLLLLYKLNLSLFILHIPPPRGGGGGVFILAVVQGECDICPINDLFFPFLGDGRANRWSSLFRRFIQYLMLVSLGKCDHLMQKWLLSAFSAFRFSSLIFLLSLPFSYGSWFLNQFSSRYDTLSLTLVSSGWALGQLSYTSFEYGPS